MQPRPVGSKTAQASRGGSLGIRCFENRLPESDKRIACFGSREAAIILLILLIFWEYQRDGYLPFSLPSGNPGQEGRRWVTPQNPLPAARSACRAECDRRPGARRRGSATGRK